MPKIKIYSLPKIKIYSLPKNENIVYQKNIVLINNYCTFSAARGQLLEVRLKLKNIFYYYSIDSRDNDITFAEVL